MFSSNDTPAEEFIYADKLGAIINLDDITHIDFLEQPQPYSFKISIKNGFGVAFTAKYSL